jgi:DNA invertase Pin-like site-specific DNA recombinase
MGDKRMTAAKNGGKRVGYIRVSTVEQNTARQLDGVAVDKTFTDRCSGRDTKRPALQAALEFLREGDVLVCHSMDRLSRSLADLLKLVEELTGRGVAIEFVKESLVFTGDDSAMSKMLLGIMGSVAQFERSLLLERQREGIHAAKKAGVYKGRKPSLTPEQMKTIRDRVSAGENKSALAREYKVTRPTIYRLVA